MSGSRLKTAALCAFLAALANGNAASAQKPGTPESIARRFFAAVAAEQWDSAAKFLDVRPVIEERDHELVMARPQHDVPLTPQVLMANDSLLTLAEATMQAAIFERQRKAHRPMSIYSFVGVRDTGELRALTPGAPPRRG